jgi:hypothetical protein
MPSRQARQKHVPGDAPGAGGAGGHVCLIPRVGPADPARPRLQYWLLGSACAGPVAAFVRVALDPVHAHTQNEMSWAAVAGGLLAMYSGAAGLAMFGRAIVSGRAQRVQAVAAGAG